MGIIEGVVLTAVQLSFLVKFELNGGTTIMEITSSTVKNFVSSEYRSVTFYIPA